MFIHTQLSDPNMFVKFGWLTKKCCHNKEQNSSKTDVNSFLQNFFALKCLTFLRFNNIFPPF